jgi:hypothetical protein
VPDFAALFADLRRIMAPFAAGLDVKRDDATEFHVDTWHVQKNRKPLFFGAVQIRKSSVSFHLMPVYVRPELLVSVSPALKARMQGKSCFNFTRADPVLFTELADLTQRAFASYREQGFV